MPLPHSMRQPAIAATAQPAVAQQAARPSVPHGLLARGASGLATVGNVLDLPGSMVRDVLAGQNPLDQLLTPTSHVNRTTGRQLMENWGWLSRNQSGLDSGDVAGFLGEVAFDPLTYVTLGASALTKAGQVARKAGVLDDFLRTAGSTARKAAGDTAYHLPQFTGAGKRSGLINQTLGDILTTSASRESAKNAAESMGMKLDDLLDQKLGGTVGIGIPGMQPFATVGQSQRFAALQDAIAGSIRQSAPVRHASALFSKRNMGATRAIDQEIAHEVYDRLARENAKAMGEIATHVRAFKEAGVFDDADLSRSVRRALEDVNPKGSPLTGPSHSLDNLPQHLQSQLAPHITGMRSAMKQQILMEQASGLDTRVLNDVLDAYFPRQAVTPERPSLAAMLGLAPSSRVLRTTHPFQKGRKDFLKGLWGGTDTLNDLSIDQQFSGLAHTMTQDQLTPAFFQQQGQKLKQHLIQTGDVTTSNMPPDSQFTKLAAWLANLDPYYGEKGVGLFTSNPLDDMIARVNHGNQAIATANLVQDMLGQRLKDAAASTHDHIPVREVLKKLGLNKNQSLQNLATKLNSAGASVTADDVAKMYVDPQTAEEVLRVMKPFSAPDEVGQVIKAVDGLTAWFRGSVTALFPAFHVRNFISGQVQNLLGGAYTGPVSAIRGLKAADNLVRGKRVSWAGEIPGLSSNADTATEQVRQLAFQHGVISGQGHVEDIAHSYRSTLTDQMPGINPRESSVLRSVSKGAGELLPDRSSGVPVGSQLAPWNMRGVTSEQNVFRPARVGESIGAYTEEMNRLAPFIEFLRQGVDPAEAARRVKALQVDYSSLTPFERKFMRRAFPFYSFSRGIAGYLADELVRRPGGLHGITIKAGARAQSQSDDDLHGVPEYIRQTAAIPLGKNSDGSRRYLTGLGLMHEDPLAFGGGGVSGAITESLSRSNPLLKGVLEWGTGESFFQRGPMGGRDIADMDPTVGRMLTNLGLADETPSGRAKPMGGLPGGRAIEFLLANSPASRALTTARTLTDDRKGVGAKALNLGSGFRVSDVSPGAQDAVLREELFAMMRDQGARQFTQLYFPKDADLNEQQRAAESLLKELQRRAKARAKAKAN